MGRRRKTYYTVVGPDNREMAGSEILDSALTDYADEIEGTILDPDGVLVYPEMEEPSE